MYLQNGEVQRNGHKGLLAAGQQRDGLQLLAGGLYLDLDAAVEDIALVLQLQPRLAAAEQLQKRLLEALVQQLELLGKNAGHLLGDLVDNAQQLLLGLLHIAALFGQVGISGVHPVELLDGADVGRTQRLDLPVQFGNAPGSLGYALQLDALLHGVAVAQFVALPQLLQDLPLLHAAVFQLLL